MAKVLNSQTISSSISKLVELPNNYIINGQFYNKTNMSPSPLDFGFYPTSSKCEMIVNKMVFPKCDLAAKTTQGILPDGSSSNISYCVKNGVSNHSDGYSYVTFFKTEKFGNDVKIKSYTWKGDAGSKQCFGNIYDQDDSYIYVSVTCKNYKTIIFRIDKETMTASGIYDLGANKYVSLIRSTDMYLYIAISGEKNYFVVSKYNKVAGTATIIKDDTGTSGGYSSQCIIANHPTNKNIFYVVRDGFMMNNLHHSVIRQYLLDVNTDTVGTSYMTLDLEGLSFGASIPNIDNKINVMNELFTFVDNGKTYMTYVRYGEGITTENSFMLTFEFLSDTDLKLVHEAKFSPVNFKMVLPVNNNKTLILGNEGQARFYYWNTYSKRFEDTATVVKPISIIGSDIDGNVLIQYEDTSVDMYSAVMALNVSANLESDFYEYEGNDIVTNVIAYAQNYNGEFVSTNVKLTLIGPAVFSATNEKTLTLTTSTINPNILPITIKESGYVRVTVEML